MKRIIVTLLAAAMLLSCVFVLASCGGGQGPKPELDLEEAEKNLDKEDYMVSFSDDKDDFEDTPWIEARLSASNDGDFLYIVVYNDSKMADLAFEEIKAEIANEIDAMKRTIKEYERILSKFEDDLDSDDVDDYEDKIKEIEKELEEYEDEYCYGKSGKTIWYGTKTAVEDSKG